MHAICNIHILLTQRVELVAGAYTVAYDKRDLIKIVHNLLWTSLVNQTTPTAAFNSFLDILKELNAAVGAVWFTRLCLDDQVALAERNRLTKMFRKSPIR